MNIQALVESAVRGEKTTVEAKTVTLAGNRLDPHPEHLAQELAALANASGGHVVLGVDSERGKNTMALETMRLHPIPRNDLLLGVLARYYKTDALGPERYLVEGRRYGVPQILSRSLDISGREPVYSLIDTLAVQLTIFPAEPGGERETP